MQRPFGRLLPAAFAALVVASFAMAPYADAAGDRGAGAAGGVAAAAVAAARAPAGGGGGGGAQAAGGGARQSAQVNNSRADTRTNNVRSGSVNNVNVERNVNVDVDNGWDNDYHPVARAAAVGTAVAVTSAVIGSMVATVPPGCVPVNYGGVVYQQCGTTWYQPQGSQFVVVNPPN